MSLVERYRQLTKPKVVGLISGTSADGIDAVLVEIEDQPRSFQVLAFETFVYPDPVRSQLFEVFEDRGSPRQLALLNTRLGQLFGQAARALLADQKADLIGSHGQTVAHLPEQRTTLQLGEPALIASLTKTLTVADFRPADMVLGGEGAPLVPYFDRWLLESPETDRVAVNIGGIANITFISRQGEVFGCDTGPGNCLSDALAELANGSPYDAGGQLARRGTVIEPLLEQLLQDPYYSQPGTKSTGREKFGRPLAREMWGQGEPADLCRTACALTAETIWRHLKPLMNGQTEVVLAGGGCENPVIVEELRRRLPERVPLKQFDDFGVPAGAREAAAFALMAHCTLHERPSSVPGATGANRPAVLGKVVFP